MLYSNTEGLSSPFVSPQLNPWSNLNTLQGSAALQPWQQVALQQLAQQLATQNAQQQPIAGPQTRAVGFATNPSIGLPLNAAPLAFAVQHIAQSLYVLAQQLTQLAAQSSMPGLFGNSSANHAFTNPAYGNQYFPTPMGQQFAPGIALH